MSSRRSQDILVFGVAVIMVAADQISKYWVRHNLVPGVPWNPAPWLRPILSFTYVTNVGASFGLFPQLRSLYPFIITGVIVVILLFYRQLSSNPRLILVSLGLQLGGALGNLLDRLLQGRVIDFIDLNFWPLHEWPVFNVADSSVVVGVCILALFLLFEKEPLASAADTTGDEDGQT